MRYDNRAQFVYRSVSKYNPKTSRSEVVEKVTNPVPCDFTNLSVSRTALEFGDVAKDINIIRTNASVEGKPTHIIVNGTYYKIIRHAIYRHDSAFYVEEVVNHENRRS